MRYEIANESFVGSLEWMSPGNVDIRVPDDDQKHWFEAFFSGEDSTLGGAIGAEEMCAERRDESEQAFNRALFSLASYSFRVKPCG